MIRSIRKILRRIVRGIQCLVVGHEFRQTDIDEAVCDRCGKIIEMWYK
jgi:hypothetical protein